MPSRILIVDDDAALLEALPETVKSRMPDVQVDVAESGRRGLTLIEANDYDALVTDIKMPEMDGLTLLERARHVRPDVPVLLVTGHGERDLAVRALRGGAYDYIEKPIDRDHFIASLARAIQARQLKRCVEEQRQALSQHASDLERVVQARTRELIEANRAKDEFLRARDRALAEAQRAQQRLSFLADATRVLVTSLDATETLMRLARFIVPILADYCVVAMGTRTGTFRRVAATHRDPDHETLFAQIAERMIPEKMAPSHPIVRVYRSGQTAVFGHLSLHRDVNHEDEGFFEAQQSLGVESVMIVPLAAHGRPLGTLTLGRTRPGPSYEAEDRALAEELARRAALAVDNARLYTDAQHANNLKDEFLATVSHELRTPLTAILGWAQMLQSGTLDETTSQRALASIERNAKFQAHLIEDLLDISRISTGKLRLDVRPVELAPIVEAAVDSARPAADAKHIRLSKVLNPKAGLISGDPDRIQQVVWNLLSNAIKFTPREGRVHLNLERCDGHVQLSITDNGQGISQEFLPYMFDLFRQADSSITRSHGGLGLGLAIVRHLVEMHGGTVEAQSEGEGRGSTFTVRFPIVGRPGDENGKPEVRRFGQGDRLRKVPELNGLHVLVVDDEPETRDLLVHILAQCGAEVRASASAQDALDVLDQWPVDVLVSDIGMPGEDGYDLIRKVRAMEPDRGGRIPAVALTAYARAEDRLRALSAGFQMHVPKPVEPVELATVLASFAWQKKS